MGGMADGRMSGIPTLSVICHPTHPASAVRYEGPPRGRDGGALLHTTDQIVGARLAKPGRGRDNWIHPTVCRQRGGRAMSRVFLCLGCVGLTLGFASSRGGPIVAPGGSSPAGHATIARTGGDPGGGL